MDTLGNCHQIKGKMLMVKLSGNFVRCSQFRRGNHQYAAVREMDLLKGISTIFVNYFVLISLTVALNKNYDAIYLSLHCIQVSALQQNTYLRR